MAVIYGIHAVTEALKSRGRAFEYIAVAKERHDGRVQKIVEQCREVGVAVRFLPREQIERLIAREGGREAAHQGVAAITSEKQYLDLEDLLARRRGSRSLLLLLDGVEDPHNLGAILRTADAAGADGVILPQRRSVGVTASVARASAGASEHLPIARVTNLGRALEQLKSHNIWTVGLDERASQSYETLDYKMDCALVLGAEGHGLHELIRRKCDFLVSIPVRGGVSSLNVSVAAGVVLYEVVRQRRAAGTSAG